MKKLYLLLLIPMLLFSKVDTVKSKLLSEISKLLLPNSTVKLYVNSSEFSNISHNFKNYTLIKECENANLVLVEKIRNLPKKCNKNNIVFVTNYQEYKNNKNIVGTIFWQKGRLNIIFKKSKLDELSIILPDSYSNFIE